MRPQLGIKPVGLALEVQSLNHCNAREVPLFFNFIICQLPKTV